ncbi:MAG: ATP-grasp domain-containing protein [Bacteriovoracaceae bacterium]|nr:ATP-grasp domain-containing protein [Bacteriovoracaceae bacterium]
MIKKILIANRGEIALRVIATCKEMGIKTVTVYSHYDQKLPHAFMADESYLLEGETIGETYLNQTAIIKIAKQTKADAIHPGYGFLSENSDFSNAVKAAGIIFIGPDERAIEIMGDKKTSKQTLEKIKIPMIPGYHGNEQDAKFLANEAKKIGFPVLIKASAGGGGKGMRIVNAESEFADALAGAKREAMNAFGDDHVLLEKYIIDPRHIEVQVMSDKHGNHLHFFERECSIQRRYQKIVEETPSVALDDKTRANICKTAVEIAKGIDYLGAGTVEFILDQKKNFYFLEMNTRLQVEHPITEMVTGYDLVKLQIQVANGEKLEIKQSDITQTGHSLECRIYAEDPNNNFLPTNGKIKFIGKSFLKNVRLDCGYSDGNDVSTQYDPMLAKLIVHAQTRDEAIAKMTHALNDFVFTGVVTNRSYLIKVLAHRDFKTGNISTDFVKKNKADLENKNLEKSAAADLMAAFLFSETKAKSTSTGKLESTWEQLSNFRNI